MIKRPLLFGNQMPITTKINRYQDAVSYAHTGGLETAAWVNQSGNISAGSNVNGVTAIDLAVLRRIRQDGYITKASVHVLTMGGANQIKFKVFRKNGSTYDFVSESEVCTITSTGTNTYTLAQPMACQIGDYIGFWASGYSGGSRPIISLEGLTGGSIGSATNVDVTTTNTFSGTASNYAIRLEYFGFRPYIVGTGDSIMAGWTERQSFYDAFSGPTLDDPLGQLQVLLPSLRYQNHAKGGQTWAWVLSTGLPSALACNPKIVIIYCGGNDLGASRTWAQVVADMDACQALIAANGARLVLCEMIPWTNGTDLQVTTQRTWNDNYAAWAMANGARYAYLRVGMGKIRVSTGFYDDLQTTPDYDSDGVHTTRLGKAYMASQWLDVIKRIK